MIDFNVAEKAQNGTETLAYSHRLNTGSAPRDDRKDLGATTEPLLILAGTADEAFRADQYEPVVSRYTQADVELVEAVTHLGLVVDPAVRPVIGAWLAYLEG